MLYTAVCSAGGPVPGGPCPPDAGHAPPLEKASAPPLWPAMGSCPPAPELLTPMEQSRPSGVSPAGPGGRRLMVWGEASQRRFWLVRAMSTMACVAVSNNPPPKMILVTGLGRPRRSRPQPGFLSLIPSQLRAISGSVSPPRLRRVRSTALADSTGRPERSPFFLPSLLPPAAKEGPSLAKRNGGYRPHDLAAQPGCEKRERSEGREERCHTRRRKGFLMVRCLLSTPRLEWFRPGPHEPRDANARKDRGSESRPAGRWAVTMEQEPTGSRASSSWECGIRRWVTDR